MKNKLKRKALIIVVVAFVVGVCSIINHASPEPSSLLLDNIEALAFDEGGGYQRCFGVGSLDCPIYKVKVYSYESTNSLYN